VSGAAKDAQPLPVEVVRRDAGNAACSGSGLAGKVQINGHGMLLQAVMAQFWVLCVTSPCQFGGTCVTAETAQTQRTGRY
jgi:hypothetical protein